MKKRGDQHTPLARLVLFLFCLSLAGSFAAMLSVAVTGHATQDAVIPVPENRKPNPGACMDRCKTDFVVCCGLWCQLLTYEPICHPARDTCLAKCQNT